MKRMLLVGLTVLFLGATLVATQFGFAPPTTPLVEKTWHSFGAIQPRISPDGTSIVFSYHGSIWRMPFRGAGGARPQTMTRLTSGAGFDIEPCWSKDGKRIAYINSSNGSSGPIQLIEAADGSPVKLPNPADVRGTVVYYKLEFHPDGRRVLGVLRSDGMDRGLAWYHIGSGKVTTVVTPPRWGRYALSNDGKWIIYTATMNVVGQQGGNDGPQADLWKVSSDGGEPVKIARFPARIHDLCWVAGDKALIVSTELGGVHHDLWNVPLDDPLGGRRKLTFGQADESRPSVSADGRWLVYIDNRDGCTALVARDLASGIDRTLTVSNIDFQTKTGKLRLQTIDESTGEPAVARVSIEHESGKHVYPPGALHRTISNYGHFYCDEQSEFALPAGRYSLRAFRGPEYKTTYATFSVSAGEATDVKVALQRWTDQADRGWYSGENHIHANYGYGEWYNSPETMLEQCAGEDLNVCNFMVANSDSDGVFDREFFLGKPDPLSTDSTLLYWNQEFRSTIWGHMTLVNLKHVVEPVYTGFKDTTNPWDIPTNSDIADRTHLQNGLVNYTHVAQNPDDPYQNPYTGKSIPIDVALGKIDSLDINNSYRGTVVLWHWLLNCGFKLPASAGTDCFLNRIRSRLPGGDRVYVKVDEPFSYAGWIEGLRAGRSFVTNGPMLELAIGKHAVGDSFELDATRELHVVASAAAQFPLDRVELIYNGRVVVTGKLTNGKLRCKIDQPLRIDKSGWLALRASGPGHADHPLGSQDAHTSPIYVEVDGKPAGSRKDAERFLKWIDRLSLAIRNRDRIPSDELRRHVQSQFEAARAVYAKIAERSD